MAMHGKHDKPDSDALGPVEQTLASFVPAGPRLDRDRLMFLAGKASAANQEPAARSEQPGATVHLPAQRRVRWFWPASTVVLAATSLVLLLALVDRPSAPPQIVYRDRPVPTTAEERLDRPAVAPPDEGFIVRPALWQPPAIPQDNYVHTREVALRLGLDALGTVPISAAAPAPALSYLQLLDSLVPTDERQSPVVSPLPPTM